MYVSTSLSFRLLTTVPFFTPHAVPSPKPHRFDDDAGCVSTATSGCWSACLLARSPRKHLGLLATIIIHQETARLSPSSSPS